MEGDILERRSVRLEDSVLLPLLLVLLLGSDEGVTLVGLWNLVVSIEQGIGFMNARDSRSQS